VKYPTSHLVFSWFTHKSSDECVYLENTSDLWDIPWYATRESFNITLLYQHPIENSGQHNQCDISAAHDYKVGCNTVEYTLAFLHSDWLYFLSVV